MLQALEPFDGVNLVEAYLVPASQNGRKNGVPVVPISCVEIVK